MFFHLADRFRDLPNLLKKAVHLLPKTALWREQDLRLIQRLFQRNLIPAPESVPFGNDHHHPLPLYWNHLQLRLPFNHRTETDITASIFQFFDHFPADPCLKQKFLSLLSRLPHVIPHQSRNYLGCQRADRRNPQRSSPVSEQPKLFLTVFRHRKDLFRFRHQHFSKTVQRNISSVLLEQRHPKFLFQRCNGMTQARLGDAQQLCGSSVMLDFGKFKKIFQICKIHNHSPHSPPMKLSVSIIKSADTPCNTNKQKE